MLRLEIKREYVRKKPIPPEKVKRVKEYIESLKKYNTILLVSITGIQANVLNEVRRKLRQEGDVLKVIKNKLFMKAIDMLDDNELKKKLEPLKEYLTGQNAVIFSNKNPFMLKLMLDQSKVYREARAGDVAQNDIILREGNTNLAPGPIISLFNKLRVPISIREGSIWITKDTVVAKKGDIISSDLAELLKRLGLKPIEVSLKVRVAYTDGLIIKGDDLEINIDEYRRQIEECVRNAVNLACNIAYPTPETIQYIIARAYLEGLNLSINAAYVTSENINYLLIKAQAEAQALYERVKSSLEQ